MLLLPMLIFFAVTFGLIGTFLWLAPSKTAQRLQAMAGPAGKSQWTATILKIVGPFAKLSTPTGDWDKSPIRVKFFNAGIRNADASLIYFGAKTLLPLFFAESGSITSMVSGASKATAAVSGRSSVAW